MKTITTLLTTLALTCSITAVSAANPLQYKPGLGVTVQSGTQQGLQLNYYFGADNTNIVALTTSLTEQKMKFPGASAKSINTNDNSSLQLGIGYAHLFQVKNSNLFWGIGAGYERFIGEAEDSTDTKFTDESWATALELTLQYRLTSQFYIIGGIAPVEYDVAKFKGIDSQTTTTSYLSEPSVGINYLF